MDSQRLTDLEPEWVLAGPGNGIGRAKSIEEAQGVMFLCPKCFLKNGGPRGTHSVLLWAHNRGVAPALSPGPGRWIFKGTDFDNLSLVAPPGNTDSVDTRGGSCGWHGWIRNGNCTILPDGH